MVLLVNALAALTVVLRVDAPAQWPLAALEMAGLVELPLFLSVLILYALQPVLERLSANRVWLVACLCAVGIALVTPAWLDNGGGVEAWRRGGWALLAALGVACYFEYRGLLYSPALTEARLHALTARIRPHFLFNSLNGVLGVIREDPRRAEQALEEIADMFRVLMKEHRELVPMDDEITLCERYLDVERLRLGDRLQVHWDLTYRPISALVPPLLLQPLLENAVYHGIEPSSQPGSIDVRVARRGSEVLIEVSNPIIDTPRHQKGNHMAQANIRERLALFFDLEADMVIDRRGGRYTVRIRFPYRRVRS